MDSDIRSHLIEIHLREFEALKAETIARISFRDNLIYTTLGAYGVIVGFATTLKTHSYAFLVLPLLSLVLGWTYIVNDEKISFIGRYIRDELAVRLRELLGTAEANAILRWANANRADRGRKTRKWKQLIVDEITFFGTGLSGLGAYTMADPGASWYMRIALIAGALMLVGIAVEIIRHADLRC